MAKTIRSSGHEALREALIAARKEAGLTQADLAKRLKCHQSLIARLESGQRRIDVVEMVVLARAINVGASDLLAVAEMATDSNHRL
ncbi:helix-turn-helix domain-containing protein [Phaeobacter sp. 11ANDIMAR09]|uniref:helix-turn-helix domain-containing protein n=1 Tax=Phaeobacter sp. 11ANDIMAR09 TaxID=1225647 RepID=UPI0006C84B3A|nr:helix-turn-helix transcriptional regulator [Phaeobacter sp. 11ANDIMAR09]KPD11054.1 XRE family transcriptional regulator [Phaeobacter sp. 11ANDIMAR09]